MCTFYISEWLFSSSGFFPGILLAWKKKFKPLRKTYIKQNMNLWLTKFHIHPTLYDQSRATKGKLYPNRSHNPDPANHSKRDSNFLQ
jgi:hypothetical protein